ncbi:HmuY family protein [Aquiflexum gelatinilyticum]|uniref:HmuY family protein n=1 Tax=Aquiflexum gelatinilyticum TaxID=2961943 RepID=UPI00216A2826|nr:HmuY family protein [Aquiflexum gelatinilyticum]MCS4433966.1 HmuY family protein [Aquiflexum gelatinilyticum]
MSRLQSLASSLAAIMVTGSIVSCEPKEEPIVDLPAVEEGLIEINGGGATFPNMVFVSLRSEEQLAVARKNWDLAFDTSSDFKVLINGTTGAMAYETTSSDINAVGEIQAEPLRTEGQLELTFTNMNSILYVDHVENPLSSPVIKAISSIDAENKVYILNRGSSGADVRPWKKIRILEKDGKYVLQHADISSANFSSIEISKNPSLNLVYFSFESGIVTVEPEKQNWDFVWTAGTSSTPFPQALNGTLAYYFQDLVYHNSYGGVSVVQVLESEIGFENFTEQNLSNLTLNSENRLSIGSSWRSGGGPTSAPSIRNDRYYILKDVKGNYYKIRFLALTKDGERGKPSFEYALVKAG